MYLGGRSSLVVRMVFVYPFKNKDINIYVSDISSTCDSLKRIMMMKNDQKMSRFTNTKCEESPWFEMAQASFSPWNLLSLFEHVRGQRPQLTGAFRPPPSCTHLLANLLYKALLCDIYYVFYDDSKCHTFEVISDWILCFNRTVQTQMYDLIFQIFFLII